MAERAVSGKHRLRARGQAVTEFALIAPVFLFVLLSLVELGRAVYYTQILDSAVRDATRYAIVHGFEVVDCSSGPFPQTGSTPRVNTCDPDGSVRVIPTIKQRAVGVLNTNGPGFVAHAKWCDNTALEAGTSVCGDALPCGDWAGASDAYPLGDGDNGRGQMVTVCVNYSYESLFKSFLPVPDFTVSARANLVVNH
jgi:hypothetical protein